ncbi:MAG TPA: hydantoinase/carbamoylase family amidase, partial [Puia sp.]
TYLGSKVVAGSFEPELLQRRDGGGISLREAVEAVGGKPDELDREAIGAGEWLGYFELHIEQGPVLYERKVPVALVKAIAGQVRAEVTFVGMAGHAGTVPMDMRKDALCGASEFVLGVEDAAGVAGSGWVATVGKLEIKDAASNVIPGEVVCSVDVRSADAGILERGYEQLRLLGEDIGSRRGLGVRWKVVQATAPVGGDERMNRLLGESIGASGYPVLELVSGAGHDAVPVSAVSPVCMLFVRCYKGISHHPLEDVEKEDLAAAIAVAEIFLNRLTEI